MRVVETPAAVIRYAVDADLAFVLDSWMRTYRTDSVFGHSLQHHVFAPSHRLCALEAIARGELRVAADPEDERVIWGWALLRPAEARVDYVYVKGDFRMHGLARLLLAGLPETWTYTHKTGCIQRKLHTLTSATFNPYPFFAKE